MSVCMYVFVTNFESNNTQARDDNLLLFLLSGVVKHVVHSATEVDDFLEIYMLQVINMSRFSIINRSWNFVQSLSAFDVHCTHSRGNSRKLISIYNFTTMTCE